MQPRPFVILLVILFLNTVFLVCSLYRADEPKERSLQVTQEEVAQYDQPQLSLEYLSGKSDKEIKEWYSRNKTISVTYQDSSLARTRIDSVLKLAEREYPFLNYSFY